jgi:hypothetical protein
VSSPSSTSKWRALIKSPLDLKTLSVKELTGRLKVCEEDEEEEPEGPTSSGKLLLIEEQRMTHSKQQERRLLGRWWFTPLREVSPEQEARP